ncbi:MAG: A24 family peptidase [Phycisphaerales bacterium]
MIPDLNPSSPLFPWAVVIGASLAAAMTDLSSRRIPNLLTLPLVALGLVWSVATAGTWWLGAIDSVAACLVLALPYVILYASGAGGGAGDAKLMGAIGAWLGIQSGFVVLVAVSLCGIALAVFYAAAQRQLRPVLANIAGVLIATTVAIRTGRGLGSVFRDMPPASEMTTIPYGVSIFLGVCLGAGVMALFGGLIG